MAYKSFEELDVWKRACKLAVCICCFERLQGVWFAEPDEQSGHFYTVKYR